MSKLLIIDDEESIRKVLSLSLASDGYDVLTAAEGEEGIEIFKEESPSIILTDIKMPGMDGIEVLKQIKELNPDAEVIMITGHGDMDSAIDSLKLDASDFLNKPIKDDALSVALRRAEERMAIRKKLKEYTDDLENMVRIATEEIKRRSDFQNKLISSSNDAVIATDEKGDIVIYNRGAERIFGYPSSEVIRKMNVEKLYPQTLVSEFKAGLEKKGDVDLSKWKEVAIVAKDGEVVPTRFSGSILIGEGEVIGSVGFFRDLREIKRLQEELIKSERLAATGQTVAGLAHYVKNILFGLKGGIYLVNIALKENQVDFLKTGWDMVKRNMGRISDMVLDLLEYSKERKPEYENCFPNEIADEVCGLMEASAKEYGVEIVKDFDPSMDEVLLDPKGIHRCLLDLVSNAIDACLFDSSTGKKWAVQVRTILENDGTVRFEVSDNGCGMDEEVKKKLFTSFFSTKEGRGTGLGLLNTQKIVQEHGGTITVDSQPGKGSTFTIRLPYRNVSTQGAMAKESHQS